MSKPLSLVPAPQQASRRCADILREAAAAADRGEVRAVLVVTLTSDRVACSSYETGDALMTLVGAAHVGIRDMLSDADDR